MKSSEGFPDAGETSASVRVLVVDDYEPWHDFISAILLSQPELQIIGRVSDGLEAVQQAQQLQPDLILLDIGLPTLNGVEAARRIHELSPKSKILFVTENSSSDIAKEALRTGASGYVVKSCAASELLPAVKAVLEGKRFLGASLGSHDLLDPEHKRTANPPRTNVGVRHPHEVGFYKDDRFLLDKLTQFIGTALKPGNATVVVATESHRESLVPMLKAQGLDIGAAIEEGRYVALDAAEVLSRFMLNGMPDRVRFAKAVGDPIARGAEAVKGENGHVAVFGECVQLLWAAGELEATISLERLWNEEIVSRYNVHVLCGYHQDSVLSGVDGHIFQRIYSEHSAVCEWAPGH